MPEFFRKKDVVLFLLFVATLHILLTHLVSSHIGRTIGIQSAGVISDTLLNQEVSKEKFQNISPELKRETSVYLNILFFLSLPFDPILQPISKQWAIRPVLEGKIHIGEYNFRAKLMGTTTRVLNSIFFSMLVYWCFRTVRQRMKQNRMHKDI